MALSSIRNSVLLPGFFAIAMFACAFGILRPAPSYSETNDDSVVAESLAAMLRAGRTVVSRHQAEINNPSLGDKGLTGAKVLAESARLYKETTGVDPSSIDPSTRHGRLLRAQMEAIAEVLDANQDTLNKQGLGFKGFIPSTFGRLVNEAFSRRASSEAEVKVTAPPDLIRNRKARPDPWEMDESTPNFCRRAGRKAKTSRPMRRARAGRRSGWPCRNITRPHAFHVTAGPRATST